MIIKGFSVEDIENQGRYSGAAFRGKSAHWSGHTGFVITRRIKRCPFGLSELGSTLWRERESNPEEKYLEVTIIEIIVNVLLFLLSPSPLSLQSWFFVLHY